VAAAQQEGGEATLSEAAWVSILGALVAVLGFLLAVAGIPETRAEIVLVDVIFVALVSILIYRIETHLDASHRPTLFKGRPVLALVVAFLALGAIAGTLAELAASSEDPPAGPAVAIYETQVQEVFRPLREANAEAFEEEAAERDPDRYANAARELGESYAFASGVLGRIEPARPGDQVLHSLLVASLASVGEAYTRLAGAVSSGAGEKKVAAARAEVKSSIAELRRVEEVFVKRGYRVTLPS